MIKSDEIKTYYVNIDNNTIEQYDYILSRFDIMNNSEWIAYKREIKINNILDDDLFSEFDINLIQNHNTVFYLETDPPDILDVSFKNVSSVIESLTISIIDTSIKSIKVRLKHLTTHWGKINKEMEKNGINFKLNQVIVRNKVHKFYLTELSKSDERNIKINQILE